VTRKSQLAERERERERERESYHKLYKRSSSSSLSPTQVNEHDEGNVSPFKSKYIYVNSGNIMCLLIRNTITDTVKVNNRFCLAKFVNW